MSKKPVTLAPRPAAWAVPSRIEGARALVQAADQRRAQMLAAATPPEAMAAAPVAPARGTMQLVPNWEVSRGGIRREAGAHWRVACALVAMNAQAVARAERRGVDAVLPFTAGQIAIADEYRTLTEWRDGSGLKCASVEAARGGQGGSGLFIDSFVQRGRWLAALQARIGDGHAMVPRYAMDRGNSRTGIALRVLVDSVVLQGFDLSMVLRRFGWQADGKNRKVLKLSLCNALDRMQGYRTEEAQNMD